MRARLVAIVGVVAIARLLCACTQRPEDRARPGLTAAGAGEPDYDALICRRRIAEVRAEPALPGGGPYEDRRIAFLGRAAGEPVVFVSAPPPLEVAPEHEDVRIRIHRALTRHARPGRRARLLRGGYLFSDDPADAFELVDRLSLPDLFDDEELWLHRGARIHRLERVPSHEEPGFAYRHADGPLEGRPAVILFADRVAAERASLERPRHRDVRDLRRRLGFSRMRVDHLAREAIVADLRFGGDWIEALLTARGARLSLACLAASKERREQARSWVAGRAKRREAIGALRGAVDDLVAERLPFDRPREAEDHLTDGRLRPAWEKAYREGKPGFGLDGEGYAVFDRDGRPHPPQTCVAMVLDTFERASGTWYRPEGEVPKRVRGTLDFDAFGIENRSGVLGFERFAEAQPELFDHRRIPDDERIPFRKRGRFFDYLAERTDTFRPGDVVAIRGLKRDGNIHQHAILIEAVDPVTGFACGLVDQMSRPRRRTWEDVMGEAPARSLYYHLRPTDALLGRLAEARDG